MFSIVVYPRWVRFFFLEGIALDDPERRLDLLSDLQKEFALQMPSVPWPGAANGFSLAGTVSKPVDAAGKPLPAVVLVGGSGATDRDETAFGIPIFGQLAGALADAGLLVLRYDKRGIGQSGGRPESASLADYADDLRAAVRYMNDRNDVDRRRIAVLGHSEGGSVAMIAASKDDRVAAAVLVASSGMTGAELSRLAAELGLPAPPGGWEEALRMPAPGTLTAFLGHVAYTYPLFATPEAVARIAAKSLSVGMPVSSWSSIRATTNGISSVRGASGRQAARFLTCCPVTRLPSQFLSSDSRTMRRLTGRREILPSSEASSAARL